MTHTDDKCPECGGLGSVAFQKEDDFGRFAGWHPCPTCNGTGKRRETACERQLRESVREWT